MRKALFIIPLFFCLQTTAQQVGALIPPAVQWQHCFGGTNGEGSGSGGESFIPTSDGGYIICGDSYSADGDLSGNFGLNDAWVIKIDAAGTIQWQKNYGGSSIDHADAIIQTADGGYLFTGNTVSNDFDVSGNHGFSDVWLVKLSSTGILQWQKCYGGSLTEYANSVHATPDGGYVIGAVTSSSDGDVTGWHPGPPAPQLPSDVWVIKVDGSGNLQWQKCYGGSRGDDLRSLITTNDGGFLFMGRASSVDGDIGCTAPLNNIWTVKLDNAGNIQWQRCFGAANTSVIQTPDGGFFIATSTYSTTVPGYQGNGDVYLIKTDAMGATIWEKLYGGSGTDLTTDMAPTADGGYLVSVYSTSVDGDVCGNKGQEDVWVFKVDDSGNLLWQKSYGGTNRDYGTDILVAADGSFWGTAVTNSTDGDISGQHGGYDIWVFKLDFPGIPLVPTISVAADATNICPGQQLRFIATITDGGSNPLFEWKVNGVNAGTNNDTIYLNTLNDGDVVSCDLTSNSACVTFRNASSNQVVIHVDPSLLPLNFLFGDTAVCRFGTIDLKAIGSFNSYMWNTGAVTPAITISQPGEYWLQVTTSTGCPGRDTVLVTLKECLKGFFMPTAFTPNNDGKNDVLKPTLAGTVLQYKFTIANRWGQIVFETSDTGKGWDGRLKGLVQDGNVYVWTCTYQLAGEKLKQAKGTFVMIR